MFQISEVQESPVFNRRRSSLALWEGACVIAWPWGYLGTVSGVRSQIFAVQSPLPQTIRFPLRLKLTLVTVPECPLFECLEILSSVWTLFVTRR